MHDQHEPTNEFIEKLEWQIEREVRLRNRPVAAPYWVPQTRLRAALALAAVIVVSMAIGGGTVATAYQAQGKEVRDVLVANLERRVDLAKQALGLARQKLDDTQRSFSLGVGNQSNVREVRLKVTEAEAQVKSIELQLEEVRITGRDPLHELSSPLVSKRDFVSERLRIDMSVQQAALEVEQAQLDDTRRIISLVGGDVIALDVARARIVEVEAAIDAFQKKLEIRQNFLNRKANAAVTELRVLQVEAEQRQKALAAKIDLAQKQSERTASLVRTGQASYLDKAEAAVRLQELETDLAKAELDVARVRQQLDQRRAR